MSTPWIQMRTNLPADPHVRRLARALKIPNAHAVGLLYVLWAVADSQTADGVLNGWDEELLDEEVGMQGFTAALLAGLDGKGDDPWLVRDADGRLRIPDFEAHMSSSAKSRALNNRRVARCRAKGRDETAAQPDDETDALPPPTEGVMGEQRPTITGARTRGEERREEEKKEEIPPPCAAHMGPPGGEVTLLEHEGDHRHDDQPPTPATLRDGAYSDAFERWWTVYPRKTGKRAAARAWTAAVMRIARKASGVQRAPPAALHDAAKRLHQATCEYAASGYVRESDLPMIPHATTWLNGDRYDDDRASWNAPRRAGKSRLAGTGSRHADSSAHNPERVS